LCNEKRFWDKGNGDPKPIRALRMNNAIRARHDFLGEKKSAAQNEPKTESVSEG
jgi:hypothetical protein